MQSTGEPRISIEACARLWRAVLEQVIVDAARPLPSAAVTGARLDQAADRAAVILEARAMILDPRQAEDCRTLMDYAGVDAISPATRRRVQAAIDADAADATRAGWYLTGGGYALFRRAKVDRTSNHECVLVA